MALIFCEGFDKYGGVNSNGTSVQSLMQQEWTSVGTSGTLAAGLSSPGFAFSFPSAALTLNKVLGANYGRIIGGVRFSPSSLGTTTNAALAQFADAGTAQCTITHNFSTGTISLRTGTQTGAVLATSSGAVTVGSVHYLEWDITIAASGAYQLWLDGVSIFSGTGATRATSNNYTNQFFIFSLANSSAFTIDDLYLFDSSGATNNAALLTSPRIETTFPASDSAAQFGFGAATLGSSVARGTTAYSNQVNTLYLRPYTPTRNCTLTAISLLPFTTNAAINLRPVVYADNSGTPNGGALLSAGSTVTGMTSGTIVTLPLTAAQSLTAGTQYWLGFMNDIAVTSGLSGADALAAGRTATSTFTSGAPGTCPTMTTGAVTAVAFGNVTSTGANYYEVASMPAQGLQSYLTDTTVGHEDLYNFSALSATPAQVYAVAVKANCSRSDSGARTVSMRVKSSATDDGGSATGQTPGTSFGWLTSLWPTDPNGNIAWTGTALNAAQSGFKIDA